jgi:hypothetical protein
LPRPLVHECVFLGGELDLSLALLLDLPNPLLVHEYRHGLGVQRAGIIAGVTPLIVVFLLYDALSFILTSIAQCVGSFHNSLRKKRRFTIR